MDLSKATAEYLAEGKFLDWWEIHNYKNCIEQLELMTKKGEADTSLLWGMCYRDGLGVKKDKAKAQQYFESVTVGSTVYFGRNYEKCKMLKCSVLEKKDGMALLLAQQYYKFPSTYNRLITPKGAVTSWLNDKSNLDGFIYSSFNKPEQKRLVEAIVTTPENPYCQNALKPNDYKAKVFLLSIQEYLEYSGLKGMVPYEGSWTLMINNIMTDYRVGGYRTETVLPREFPFLYFGEFPDKASFKGKTGLYTRTPGEKKGNLCYFVDNMIFPRGSNAGIIPYLDVKILYQPAFWVKLD